MKKRLWHTWEVPIGREKKNLMGWGQDKTRQDMKLNRYMQEH